MKNLKNSDFLVLTIQDIKTMFAFALKVLALIIWAGFISDNPLAQQTTTVNTQYIKIGNLYPRVEYSGVLINLNVRETIERASQAVKIASKFINHHYAKINKLQAWKGADRHYNFLALKTKKVNQNLKQLKTTFKRFINITGLLPRILSKYPPTPPDLKEGLTWTSNWISTSVSLLL